MGEVREEGEEDHVARGMVQVSAFSEAVMNQSIKQVCLWNSMKFSLKDLKPKKKF